MGVRFSTTHGYVEGTASDATGRLTGAHLVLEYPSHTATDNLLMAAALAKGTTVIDNAAREPEVGDLAAILERPNFGVFAQIADKDHFVDAAGHGNTCR